MHRSRGKRFELEAIQIDLEHHPNPLIDIYYFHSYTIGRKVRVVCLGIPKYTLRFVFDLSWWSRW